MEKWTEVRRRVLTGELSKRAACQEYGINWRTLVKMLAHAEPPGYRRKAKREQPVVGPHLAWIHEVLEHDKQEPVKQRHTAKRIFDRLKVERGYTGGYTMVKEAVRTWKDATKEVFVPLSHPPGEAQVDFGFAYVDVAGERQQIALFVMSLPYSDAVYIQAFPRECTEAFVEGHNRAFRFIGGVPKKIRYDNSKIAVAKITGSRERQVTKEFQRLQSHYLFETQFCLVRRANEKGHVEGLVDFGRANFLVPVPKVASLVELNETLEERCREDLGRRSWGKNGTKALRLEEERSSCLPLPAQECEARRITQANANSLSLVQFDTNRYSVPVKYAHQTITVVATVDDVKLVYEDRLVARHRRHWGRERYFYDPIHYLALLERKPGAFDYARPLADWQLPECFNVLRRRMELIDRDVPSYFQSLERLLRYCARPPFALERLSVTHDASGRATKVRYVLPRHKAANWVGPGRSRTSTRPGANGVVELSPFEFLDRLADLVPPPRKHRHRYHGVFAPNHKLRRAVTALAIGNVGKQSQAACCLPLPRGEGRGEGASAEGSQYQKPRSHDTSRIAWAKLMARVGEEFPLACPTCGGDIRLIAFITDPGPIRKILTHLGEPLEPPPVSPARGPPIDWRELVQVHDDRAIFQASPDELPVIDIHSL